MIDGLAVKIQIGSDEVRGWLPLLPDRFALINAAQEHAGRDRYAASVLAAAVGLCWGGELLKMSLHTRIGPVAVTVPPGPRALVVFGGDLVAFGDAVSDALMRLGYAPIDIFTAGGVLLRAVTDSIPTMGEVEASADFSEATPRASTVPTSRSA
jgi:hypothetical protein